MYIVHVCHFADMHALPNDVHAMPSYNTVFTPARAHANGVNDSNPKRTIKTREDVTAATKRNEKVTESPRSGKGWYVHSVYNMQY